jgi:hypothetical protein
MRHSLTAQPPLVHLTLVTGSLLYDALGNHIGQVTDLTAQIDGDRAPITAAIARVERRTVRVPVSEFADLGYAAVRLEHATAADLEAYEAREGELRLAKEVLDNKLIDIRGRRLVHANEIELMRIDG